MPSVLTKLQRIYTIVVEMKDGCADKITQNCMLSRISKCRGSI